MYFVAATFFSKFNSLISIDNIDITEIDSRNAQWSSSRQLLFPKSCTAGSEALQSQKWLCKALEPAGNIVGKQQLCTA